MRLSIVLGRFLDYSFGDWISHTNSALPPHWYALDDAHECIRERDYPRRDSACSLLNVVVNANGNNRLLPVTTLPKRHNYILASTSGPHAAGCCFSISLCPGPRGRAFRQVEVQHVTPARDPCEQSKLFFVANAGGIATDFTSDTMPNVNSPQHFTSTQTILSARFQAFFLCHLWLDTTI